MEDCTCLVAWDILQKDPEAIIVDVRTEKEWQQVGLPNININQLLLNTIRFYPGMNLNSDFIEILLEKTRLASCALFLCKSGVRSKEAAMLLTSKSDLKSYNIIDGFEGNTHGLGWLKSGLPSRSFEPELNKLN